MHVHVSKVCDYHDIHAIRRSMDDEAHHILLFVEMNSRYFVMGSPPPPPPPPCESKYQSGRQRPLLKSRLAWHVVKSSQWSYGLNFQKPMSLPIAICHYKVYWIPKVLLRNSMLKYILHRKWGGGGATWSENRWGLGLAAEIGTQNNRGKMELGAKKSNSFRICSFSTKTDRLSVGFGW